MARSSERSKKPSNAAQPCYWTVSGPFSVRVGVRVRVRVRVTLFVVYGTTPPYFVFLTESVTTEFASL